MKTKLAVLLTGICIGAALAPAADLKVYIFAGQSNMAGGITAQRMGNYSTDILDWIEDPGNPVIYHFWKGPDPDEVSAAWTNLNYDTPYGLEHVAAYRLWNYWQAIDTNINVAIIKVCQGSTSLRGQWNPGGRDKDPWLGGSPETFEQGYCYQALTNKLAVALGQLDDAGADYDIEAFFWYQGEGDSSRNASSGAYRMLFEDLAWGWTNRNPVAFPYDDTNFYGGSVRDLCSVSNLPTFVARINWQTKGSASWGARDEWEWQLANVRNALVDFTEDHPDCGWINVDDIPLKDEYHYDGENYAEIGDRFARLAMETLYDDGSGPWVNITTPSANAAIPVLQSTISCSGTAADASNQPVGTLEWISSADGSFGSAADAVLSASGWLTNITSVGAAAEPENYVYTTSLVKKIEFRATLPDGLVLADQHWISETPDGDGDGLPDDWETAYYGSATAADTNAMAANGINTVLEAYIAGISPSDPDARFGPDSLTVDGSQQVLRWTGLSGRRYSVYWTTNLLEGFGAPIAAGIPWPSGGFTNTTEDAAGFYRIETGFQ